MTTTTRKTSFTYLGLRLPLPLSQPRRLLFLAAYATMAFLIGAAIVFGGFVLVDVAL